MAKMGAAYKLLRATCHQTPVRCALCAAVFPPLGRKKMISYLYVEDDADIREGVASVMEAGHREIVAVPHAEAALAMDDSTRFDVLVTDISLPGISGIDLAKQWLADDPSRHVLLLSGYELQHGLRTIGPNVRALLKSADPEELETALLRIEGALPSAAA